MSNTNSIVSLMASIMNTICDTLDISNRYGNTGYIDFIKQTELQENNIMKGMDDYRRLFIVFKAEVIYDDNTKRNTFTTVFQRFDKELLWHSCGHDGQLLFDTVGGINATQLQLLDNLLKNGFVDLTPDMDYDNLKFCGKNSKTIKKIQIGYSSI